jgi:hypothetical protein
MNPTKIGMHSGVLEERVSKRNNWCQMNIISAIYLKTTIIRVDKGGIVVIACMDCWKKERKRQRISESLLVQQINWDNSNKLLFIKCCLHVVMYEQEGRHSPYRTYSYITFPAITTHRLPFWYHHLFSCASGSPHSIGVDIPNSGDTSDISVHCGSIRSTEAKKNNLWYKMTRLQYRIPRHGAEIDYKWWHCNGECQTKGTNVGQ